MAADMLDSVLKKESEVAENEAAAAEKAKAIIEKAKNEADEKIKTAKAICEENEKNQLDCANADFKKSLELAADEAQKYVDGIKRNSEVKLSEAVGLVKSIISA